MKMGIAVGKRQGTQRWSVFTIPLRQYKGQMEQSLTASSELSISCEGGRTPGTGEEQLK